MALIEFKNLPDTSTPLNAENLNHNFNELLPVTLYENQDGTTANLTLKETSANYGAVEIMYGCDGYHFSTGKIYNPDGKKTGLFTPSVSETTDERIFVYTSDWQISGSNINFIKASNKYLTESNSISSFGTNSYIRIYKVVGYKEVI